MYIQEGKRRLILPWERDGKGMGTLHGSGRFEMHAELCRGSQTENILSIGGRIILKIMFENSMGSKPDEIPRGGLA
jgi:hypothetical protein